MTTLLLVLTLLLPVAHYRVHGAAALPDSVVTPGAVVTTDTAVICRAGYATRRRAADSLAIARLRYAVYRSYQVAPHTSHQFDHLIPLELGGASVAANLWAEPSGRRFGYQRKDQLENLLRRRVCTGALALPTAQQLIARDWYALALHLTS